MMIKKAIKSQSKTIGFLPMFSMIEKSIDCCLEFTNPPYHINTLVFIGSPKKLIKYILKNYGSDLSTLGIDFNSVDGLTIPCTASNGSKIVIIYLPSFNFTLQDFSTLVHEIEHASVYILKFSGCHPVMFENDANEDSDDESIAYLEGNLFNKIIKKISKKFLTSLDKFSQKSKK